MWLRKNGTPYYVGKGKGNRAYKNDGERSVRKPKCYSRILVQHWGDEQEAFSMEKFWIYLFGRIDIGTGVLRNRTDGGDGPSGIKRSSVYLSKQSKRMLGTKLRLGKTFTTSTKAHISYKIKELWKNSEYREHMKLAHAGQGKGRKLSEHTKELCRKNHNPNSNKNLRRP